MPAKESDTMPAAKFKANVLKVLDKVARTGRGVTVTKHGKPVARVEPVRAPRSLKGSVLYEGDLISPIDVEWEAG
jgi:prevent-host-death family protein